MNVITRCTAYLVLTVFMTNVAFHVANAQTIQDSPRSASGKRMMQIRVFFTNPKSPDFAITCAAGDFVNRTVPITKEVANAALRLVFAGPTAQEKAKGMDLPPALTQFYHGVSIKRGVAVVNFRSGAQKHLYVSGPVCMTEKALAPIYKTLLQFKTIKSVKYAINGRIIKDWDA